MGDRVEAESASLPSPGPFTAAAVDAAGERVAAAGPRGVAVFDAPPGGGAGAWALAAAWELEGGAVPTQIAIGHPDHGSALAVASSDGALTLWHEACGPPPRPWARAARFVGADGAAPTALAFAPAAAGPRLAAGCADGSVRVYVATALLAGPGCGWELESIVDGASSGRAPACVAWRPHDAGAPGGDLPALLAVGGRDGVALHCYSPAAAAWTRAATLPAPAPATAVAWAAAPSPSAPDAVAVAAGPRVDVWHVRGAADALTVERAASLPHASPVWRLEWQPLSGALIAGTDDGKVVAWRAGLGGDWVPVGAVVADGAVPPDATAVAV